MNDIREKHHRLDADLYHGNVVVAFTCCEQNRRPMFTNDALTRLFMTLLEQQTAHYGCDILVYMFMPDHVHALLAGRDETSDTLNAMRSFKQHTGYWLSRNDPQHRWQKDYYDHILRTWERGEEEIRKHVRYILCNPVRKGLVEKWQDYPYKGSTTYRLDEWE